MLLGLLSNEGEVVVNDDDGNNCGVEVGEVEDFL
jgi:hypothetical protein